MADDAAAPEGEVSESAITATDDTGIEPAVEDLSAEESGAEEYGDDEPAIEIDEAQADAAPAKPKRSHVWTALVAGLVIVLALAGLTGWLGFRAYQSHQLDAQRKLFLQVGRQGALNLTTIDFEHADADVQRILDSATGSFYDEFQERAQPFIEVVKQAKSKSVGTVTQAGLIVPEQKPNAGSPDTAQVLVAVTVKTSNAGAAEQQPRLWRMRITVAKVGADVKVSKVEFVP